MTDLNPTIASALTARYGKLADVVRELAAPLSDEQFWAKPFAFGNSFGHLILHLTGNLNYYIGAQIAGTGYVRDRPLEFSGATRPSRRKCWRNLIRRLRWCLAQSIVSPRKTGRSHTRRLVRTPRIDLACSCRVRPTCTTTLAR